MSEFKIVIQIEQLDDNGNTLCTYGPNEPVTLYETDDADEAIDCAKALERACDLHDAIQERKESLGID